MACAQCAEEEGTRARSEHRVNSCFCVSDGNYVTLGYYDIASDNLTWGGIEKWPGGKKPQDRTIVVPVLREVSQGLFIAMCLLASVGIMACILLLGFNCKHQHRR